MINGTEWLVVTKMDVMDECAEIPVCTHYEIDGKITDRVPADVRGFRSIKPVYKTLKGWNCSTEGITEYDKLPQLAKEYLELHRAGIRREDRGDFYRAGSGADDDAAWI